MASSSKKPEVDDLADLEKLLNREASAFQREVEVDRILKAFKLNPYDILDLDGKATPEEIKKKYRQISLFIHPDKCPHPRAPEAFDLLKKAESELMEDKKRQELDAAITQARSLLLRAHNLPPAAEDHDPRIQALKPPFREQLRARVRDFLIEEELRRRKAIKMTMANEGREAQQKDEEVMQKKRKAEDDKTWEERREGRVDSWRDFAKKPKKKQKKGPAIIG